MNLEDGTRGIEKQKTGNYEVGEGTEERKKYDRL